MKSSRLLDRRAGFSFASIMLLLAMVAPSLMPMFASAAQITSRSIQMSNSAASQTGVTYKVTFTPTQTYKGIVIDWCQDSPVLNSSCTAPATFTAGTTPSYSFSANGPSGTMNTTNSTASHTVIGGSTASASATAPVTLVLSNVTNPSVVGSFYARIYTYGSATPDWSTSTNTGTVLDSGAVALSTTSTVALSAVVRETLQFCLSAAAPGPGCGTTGQAVTPPTLVLGHGAAGQIALDSSQVDTVNAYAQLSTNATNGAVVAMTNSNSCGGLKRTGAATCEIPAAGSGANTTGGFAIPTSAGSGLGGFGLNASTTASAGGTSFGSITALAPYNGTAGNYGMDTTSTSNVTTTYGSSVFQSGSTPGPVANQNTTLTFGAAAANNSPAGTYTANMNFVATGTF